MRFLIFAIYWPWSQLTTNPPCSKHCPVLPADRLLGESYTCFHQVSDVENHTVEFSRRSMTNFGIAGQLDESLR